MIELLSVMCLRNVLRIVNSNKSIASNYFHDVKIGGVVPQHVFLIVYFVVYIGCGKHKIKIALLNRLYIYIYIFYIRPYYRLVQNSRYIGLHAFKKKSNVHYNNNIVVAHMLYFLCRI